MKKILLFIVLASMPLLHARTIKIINNAGATLLAKVEMLHENAREHKIPSGATEEASTKTIDIANKCFVDVVLSMFEGPNKGLPSVKAYGVRTRTIDTCADTTFIVEIKNGAITWFRK